METSDPQNLYRQKIRAVIRAERWLGVKRFGLRIGLLAGLLGFGVYGTVAALAAIVAIVGAPLHGERFCREMLAQVPLLWWPALGLAVAAAYGLYAVSDRYARLHGHCLDLWSKTGTRRLARLERWGDTRDPADEWRQDRANADEEALSDLGGLRHAQQILGSSLVAPGYGRRIIGQMLEDRAGQIEAELEGDPSPEPGSES